MNLIRNLKISSKLLVALALMGVSALGTAWYGASKLRETDHRYGSLVEGEAHAALWLSRANTAFLDATRIMSFAVLEDDPARIQAAFTELASARRTFDDRLSKAEQALPGLAADLAGFRTELQRARSFTDAIRQAALANRDDEAKRALIDLYSPAQIAARSMLIAKLDQLTERLEKTVEAEHQASDAAFRNLLVASVLGIVLPMVLALLIMRVGVSRPIAQIALRMRELAAGDKTSPIPGSGRRDEVGGMAKAVEGFRLAALEQDRLASLAAAESAAKAARGARVEALVRGFEEEAAA
ncbi:HAMP domain-containing protein, partial [Muricoccus vinaceus]